jgi:putative transposase
MTRDAVAQITERGYPVAEVSKRLGVSRHSLYAWRRKFSKPSVSTDDDQATQIRRLKKELARVTEERGIPKKPPRISPRMQGEIRVRCDTSPAVQRARDVSLLSIRPSGFYAWLKNPLSKRAREDARQTELLNKAWKESGRVYGYRKLHDDLLDQGESSCANRIARLARLAGIKA